MKNEYTVDWELLKKWTNESRHTGFRLFFYIVWCVWLVVSILFIVLSIGVGMYDFVICFVFTALFSFYRAFIWNTTIAKQQYKRLAQTYGKNSWVRTIYFEDNEIVVKEEKTEIKYNYSDILKIVEKGENIHLLLPGKTIIRLYQSKFIDCNWEDCKRKILENNSTLM